MQLYYIFCTPVLHTILSCKTSLLQSCKLYQSPSAANLLKHVHKFGPGRRVSRINSSSGRSALARGECDMIVTKLVGFFDVDTPVICRVVDQQQVATTGEQLGTWYTTRQVADRDIAYSASCLVLVCHLAANGLPPHRWWSLDTLPPMKHSRCYFVQNQQQQDITRSRDGEKDERNAVRRGDNERRDGEWVRLSVAGMWLSTTALENAWQ